MAGAHQGWLPGLSGGTLRSLALVLMVLTASTLGSGRSSFAGFMEGLEAYDAGDLQSAYEAWLPLAEAGDLQAQVALAGLLEVGGQGLAADLPQAVAWYQRAAVRGDPVAQMNLGDFYARGHGVPRDLARGFAWLTLAAEQGRRWAVDQQARLSAAMPENKIKEAQALASELRAAY